jgi:hypothetical protein
VAAPLASDAVVITHQIAPWLAGDKAETDHLLALAAAAAAAAAAGEGRLRIFRCDLLDGAVLLDAARGCSEVFHLASPCTIDPVSDPQVPTIPPVVATFSTSH